MAAGQAGWRRLRGRAGAGGRPPALAVLENVRDHLRAGGWVPWEVDDITWFDFTQEGRWRLYRHVRACYAETNELRVPGKYGMTFRIKCTEGCATREPPYLFLVDVGVSDDIHGRGEGRRRAAQQAAGSAR